MVFGCKDTIPNFVQCFLNMCLSLFLCVLYLCHCRLWLLQWTGCHTSQKCFLLCSSTSQSQWLFMPKNTFRKFLTSLLKQIKGQIHTNTFHVFEIQLVCCYGSVTLKISFLMMQ